MLIVNNITKRYGLQDVLSDVSFHIEQGQIVGLLGENGAGKSTTMNIVTGYISADEGEVIIEGIDLLDKPKDAKKRIGYLPEQPPLYDKMTVQEYLVFAAGLKGITGKATKAEAERVMNITNLIERRHMLIRHLSKGFKQRVGLAQALVGDPPLLILDEPMVGLDPNQMIEIRNLIRSLGKDHTIILSSHILSEIESVCDHIIILSHGKVIAENEVNKLESENANQNHLRIVVKGNKSKIGTILKKSKLIKDFTFIRDVEEGVHEYQAIASTDRDIRDDLFLLFAGEKMVVYSLNVEQLTLEDVFMKLTGKEEEA